MAIKRHCKILVPILIFCSTTIFSQGIEKKSFVINSLENKSMSINVELDNVNNSITITLTPSVIIHVCDYMGNNRLEKMEVINKKFLFISFGIFGGSGVELGETMCICVSKGYLYKALYIISIDNEYFSKTYNKEVDAQDLYDESKKSKVTFINIQEDKKNNFKLLATEYDTVKSKHDPGTSHEIFDTLIFNFDKKNKVFYNKYC